MWVKQWRLGAYNVWMSLRCTTLAYYRCMARFTTCNQQGDHGCWCSFQPSAHLTAEHIQRFAAILWSLWKHKNLKVWEDKNEPCAMIVDRACNNPFFVRIYLFIIICVYRCLIVCLCVWCGISGFLGEKDILVIFMLRVFW